MTNTSPITDIHAAETAAKKQIADSKSDNAQKITQTKEEEEQKLATLEEELRTAGREKIATAKAEAGKAADDKLKQGKANDESMINVARGKLDDAVAEGVRAFNTHIGV
jgi:vacuolar-type H+-ATPase subunit H